MTRCRVVAVALVAAITGACASSPARPALAVSTAWRWRAPDEGNIGAPAADGRGVVVARPGLAVVAFDRRGQVRWQARDGTLGDVAPLLTGDLVVASTDGALIALTRTDGARRWAQPIAIGASSPADVGGLIVAVAGDGEVVAVHPDGRRAWGARLPDGTLSQPPAGADGVVVATWRGGITALDAATGRVRWQRALPPLPSGPAVTGGVAVVLDGHGVVHGFDLDDGTERWTDDRPAPGQPEVPPTVLRPGVVAVADELTGLAAFDVATGRRRWFREGPGAAVRGGPTSLGGEGDRVALPDDAGTVLVLSGHGRDRSILDPIGRASGIASAGRGRLAVATRDAERNEVIVYRIE